MNKRINMKTNDWVAKCSQKYFKLTGRSPKYSFWSFCDSIGLEENIEGFKQLYEDLDSYFPLEDSDD